MVLTGWRDAEPVFVMANASRPSRQTAPATPGVGRSRAAVIGS